MGLIGTILDLLRTDEDGAPVDDVTVDHGGGANVTARHFGAPGDDSPPLPGDLAFTVDGPGSGGEVAIGYLDQSAKAAEAGEKRIYARDSDGNPVMVVWLKQTGGADDGPSIELGINATDHVALASRVLEELESVKSDLSSLRTVINTHKHTGVTTGSGTSGPTDTTAPAPHTPESVASETVKVQP